MALKSSRKPVYAVISFSRARGGVAIDGAVPASGERAAMRIAERLAEERVGAIAFSRTGDPEIGEFDDPVVLARFGTIPDDLAEIMGL